MLLTVKLSAAGTVAVSGSAVKTLKKGMAAGQRQLSLTLTKGGRKSVKHRRKLSLRATLTVGKQTTSKTTSVKP